VPADEAGGAFDASARLDDDAGPVVRSFAIIAGRTDPRLPLDLLTHVVATIDVVSGGGRSDGDTGRSDGGTGRSDGGTGRADGDTRSPEGDSVNRERADAALGPEHRAILERAVRPVSVAELASHLDRPVGVVKVLLSDLHEVGAIEIAAAASVSRLPDDRALNAVIHGLRSL